MTGVALQVLAVALLGSAAAGKAPQCPVALTIEFPTADVELTRDGYLWGDTVKATVTNVGDLVVTLVQPGDGSGENRRTPSVAWVVDQEVQAPGRGGCGNINSLRSEEVFDLFPGQALALSEWIPPLQLRRPGTYEIQLLYRNDPSREMDGIPLGQHDADALERMKRSTVCELKSNPVRLTVRMPKPAASIPELARDVTKVLLPWALEGAPLPVAEESSSPRFPDAKCVHDFLDAEQPPFVFVNWQGPGFSVHQEATWKWDRDKGRLEVLTDAEAEDFVTRVLYAPYVPGPWFRIALDQRSDGTVDLTFRYGHAAGAMLLDYVSGSLRLKGTASLELDEAAVGHGLPR